MSCSSCKDSMTNLAIKSLAFGGMNMLGKRVLKGAKKAKSEEIKEASSVPIPTLVSKKYSGEVERIIVYAASKALYQNLIGGYIEKALPNIPEYGMCRCKMIENLYSTVILLLNEWLVLKHKFNMAGLISIAASVYGSDMLVDKLQPKLS